MIRDGFSFYRPCAPLRPYVRYYWVFESSRPVSALTFPVGCTQFIFHKRSPLYVPELDVSQHRFTVSGQVDFPSHLCSGGDTEMIAVVFHPYAMGAFLDIPVFSLHNREISGFDMDDTGANCLAARVLDCADNARSVAVIERWLLSRLARMSGRRSENIRRICAAVESLYAEPRTSVAELSSAACLSRKQFERLFRTHVGMNPKEYAGVARFQRALSIMQHIPGVPDCTRIAYDSGYADQSHFTREFRRFSGLTPAAFMRVCQPYSDLFSDPLA